MVIFNLWADALDHANQSQRQTFHREIFQCCLPDPLWLLEGLPWRDLPEVWDLTEKGSQEGRHRDISSSRALLEHPACHPVGWDYHSWPGQENQGTEITGGPAHPHDFLAPAPQPGWWTGATGFLVSDDEADGRWARLHLCMAPLLGHVYILLSYPVSSVWCIL